ncbi:MAG: hypothetical protein QXL38_01070 [Candidatus Bathyarchaeia archaeon]
MTIVSHLLQIAGESFQTLLVFNILFICIFFPLDGSLKRKMMILVAGNILCFIWSALFSMLVADLIVLMGDASKVLLAVLSPLLNLLWIVSFWSVSLTFLAKSKRGKR